MSSVRAVWAILKRELYAFFVSPMAYVLLTVWLLASGFTFYMLARYFASQPFGASGLESPLSTFFGQTTLFYLPMLVFVPLVTMRLLAEERSRGTIELLMTAPVTELAVVIGKYLAALVIWLAMWAPTLLYVWLTSRYGDVDLGTVAASYVGVLGIGAYYLAIGLLMSALSRNQMVAAILSFFALGGLFMIGLGQFVFGSEHREVFAYLSIWGHMESFSRGVVDSRYLVFDGSLAALGVALTWLAMRGAVRGEDIDAAPRARALAVLNVLLVLGLAFQVNYLSYRHYDRWDWTESSLYTLSDRSEAVLRELDRPVTIWVLLSESEPGFAELRNLLARYLAESDRITVEYVDPDREPAAYGELARRFHLGTLMAEGTPVADVAAVVEAGERHWEITRDDLVSPAFDDTDEDSVTLNVEGERAITGALVELTTGEPTKVCVTRGHNELGVAGTSRSLAGLAAELRRENLTLEEIETRGQEAVPADCDAVLVIGPTVAFAAPEAQLLRRYVEHGGNLLVALDPVPAADQQGLVTLGLEDALRALGVRVDRTIVVERDTAFLPVGGGHPIGPFAVAGWGEHAITAPFRGLGIPIVVSEARSVRPVEGGTGTVLFSTSEESYAETDLRSLRPGVELEPSEDDLRGPVPLAVAVEVPQSDAPADDDAPRGGRLVVIGDATLFASELLEAPTVLNRNLASALIGWLSAREALVSIEARTVDHQPVSMSQEDVDNLFWRVVVLIPLAFVFLGFAVWWNRRQ